MGTPRRRATTAFDLVITLSLAGATAALAMNVIEYYATDRAIRQAQTDVRTTNDLIDGLARAPRDSLIALEGWTRLGRWSLNVRQLNDSTFTLFVMPRAKAEPILAATVHPRSVDRSAPASMPDSARPRGWPSEETDSHRRSRGP